MTSLGARRYYHKRMIGLPPGRYDGSESSVETDHYATEAARWGCRYLGLPFDSSVRIPVIGYDTHVRLFGRDFSIQLIWQGWSEDGERFRSLHEGHLIINPEEPQRWAHIYASLCGGGTSESPWQWNGWTTHAIMLSTKKTQEMHPGYGLKWTMVNRALLPIEGLRALTGGFLQDVSSAEVSRAIKFLDEQPDALGDIGVALIQPKMF